MRQHHLPPALLTDLNAAILSHNMARFITNPVKLSSRTVFIETDDFSSLSDDTVIKVSAPTPRLLVLGSDVNQSVSLLGAFIIGEPNPNMWQALFKDKDVPNIDDYLLAVFVDNALVPNTNICFLVGKHRKEDSVEVRMVSSPTCSIKVSELAQLQPLIPVLGYGATFEASNAIWF